jgi:hypothetical protein
MSWMAKAALAAALLNCGLLNASAQDGSNTGQWLKAGDCSLYSAGAGPGDTVQWTGACVGGYAEGLGTATFAHDGQTQSFTANFVHGVIPDGHVITRWGRGWSYDGETIAGRFNGSGILTTDASDRFDGQWNDGKMNGFGVLLRANGERYVGDWKDDKPNGKGELRHVDGSQVSGNFVDGKLENGKADQSESPAPTKISTTSTKDAANEAPFGGVSGKTLIGVDGSSIALTLIEGGMELQVVPAGGMARKTTFTFMTDRMGTVVEDSGSPSAGSSVTGFFRLTTKGVEVRYADGRSAMLSANPDGGVQMKLDSDAGPACHAWYPAGHQFSDLEKKAALNAYASKLGLPVTASDVSNGCPTAVGPQPASLAPSTSIAPRATAPAAAASARIATPRPRPDRKVEARNEVKVPARMAKASYHIGDYQAAKEFETVTVRPSDVHPIDAPPDAPIAAISVPDIRARTAASSDKNDASHCLKVDSDGGHWGFRNSCDFAVQFAYCMAGGSDNLTACGSNNVVTTSATGSVAARGFGALMSDNSLADKDASHNFRWVACSGGAGEVVAHLDKSEPPAGRCERAQTASTK